MSNTPLASRVLRALGETLDFYIALKNEETAVRDEALADAKALVPAEPGSAFGGSYAGRTVAVGRKRDSRTIAKSASGREQDLSPAEDTQNIMNGIMARVAGNTNPDGS
mgnify:CR=1 FL=1